MCIRDSREQRKKSLERDEAKKRLRKESIPDLRARRTQSRRFFEIAADEELFGDAEQFHREFGAKARARLESEQFYHQRRGCETWQIGCVGLEHVHSRRHGGEYCEYVKHEDFVRG